jgi:hypothetical protein
MPLSVTMLQPVRLREVSAVQLLTARMPLSVTMLQPVRLREVSAVQLLTAFRHSAIRRAAA